MPSSANQEDDVQFAHRRTADEVRRCKRLRRDIKLSEWGKNRYAEKEEVLTRPIDYDSQTVPIPRVRRSDITPQWFQDNVAALRRPLLIEGCCDEWLAMQRWSIEALEERFRHVSFKVGKDNKGKKIRMKFKYYADYLRRQRDDTPLYLFESDYSDDSRTQLLDDDYSVPDLFPHDWFGLINRDARPPHNWWCIGPKRSGSTVHIDPLGTAAWNAVTHGCKRWVLFEPGESKKQVKGKDCIREGEGDEAIQYFDFILPRLKKAYPKLKVYEGLQHAGDVIFVPGDWWHGVLNLEDSVAVTRNYCGPDNFEDVWKRTRREREKVAWLWLRNMRKFAPTLHDRAIEINRWDGFKMRHQRPKGHRLSDANSSSSESSTDSSSDEACNLASRGIHSAARCGLAVGPAAAKKQTPWPEFADRNKALAPAPGDGGPAKRRRLDHTDPKVA